MAKGMTTFQELLLACAERSCVTCSCANWSAMARQSSAENCDSGMPLLGMLVQPVMNRTSGNDSNNEYLLLIIYFSLK
ncbi:hypothetical protein D3C71_1933900 [compost metagenome]